MNQPLGRRLAAMLGVLAAVLSAVGILAVSPAAAANCPSLQAFVVPGNTEVRATDNPNTGHGLTGDWANLLQQKVPGSAATTITYNAEVGGPVAGLVTGQSTTQKDSSAQARNGLTTSLQQFSQQCPNTPITVAGYSLGAGAAGDVAAAVGRGEVKGVNPNQIRSVELFGDPRRGGADKSMGGVSPGGGVMGAGRNFGQLGNRVYSACTISDPICGNKATEFGAGLGGNQATQQAAIPLDNAQQQALLEFLNINPSWEGSNGLPMAIAKAAGPWVAFQQQHAAPTYSTPSATYGGNSAIGSSVDRVASGKTQPLGSSAAQQAAAQPNAQLASALPGLTQLLGGAQPAAAVASPVAGQPVGGGSTGLGLVPGQGTTSTTFPGIATAAPSPSAGIATAAPTPGLPSLQNVDQQGLGNLVGLLVGTR